MGETCPHHFFPGLILSPQGDVPNTKETSLDFFFFFYGDLVLECVISEIMPSACCHCELVKEGNSVFLMLSILNKKVATRLLGNTNIYRLIETFEHLLQWCEMSGCFQLISYPR